MTIDNKISVQIVPGLHVRYDEAGQAKDVWATLHAIVARADVAAYYGMTLASASEAPAANASLCDFRVEKQAAGPCTMSNERHILVNLPSDLNVEVLLGRHNIAGARFSETPKAERRSRLKFNDDPTIGPSFFAANFDTQPSVSSQDPDQPDRKRFIVSQKPLPFAQLFNLNVWQALRREREEIEVGGSAGKWTHEQSNVIDQVDTVLGQGSPLVLDADWFGDTFPDTSEVYPIEVSFLPALSGRRKRTNYHWALGLLVRLCDFADAATVYSQQYLLRFADGSAVNLNDPKCKPDSPLPEGEYNGCEALFGSLAEGTPSAPQPTIELVGEGAAPVDLGSGDIRRDTVLGARVYCIRTISPFVSLNAISGHSGSCGSTYQFHKLRAGQRGRVSSPRQSSLARRAVIQTTRKIPQGLKVEIDRADKIEATVHLTLSGTLRPYRDAAPYQAAPGKARVLCEYLPDENGKDLFRTLIEELKPGNGLKTCCRWSDPGVEAIEYIGTYQFDWDAALQGDTPGTPRTLFLVSLPGDAEELAKGNRARSLSIVFTIESDKTQSAITLKKVPPGEGAKPDDPTVWEWMPDASQNSLVFKAFDLLEFNHDAFREGGATVLDKDRGGLDSLFVGVDYSDLVSFEFAQSAAALEQHIYVSHDLSASEKETLSSHLQDDLQNFSRIRVLREDKRTKLWELLGANSQSMPIDAPTCSGGPNAKWRYEFHYRLSTPTVFDAVESTNSEKANPASFYQLLYRDETLDDEGFTHIKLHVQHTYGDVRGSAEYLARRHLDFAVANVAEIRWTAEEADIWTKMNKAGQLAPRPKPMLSLTLSEDEDRVTLLLNLRRLVPPASTLPAKGSANEPADNLARAQWRMYFEAWKCVAEVAESESISLLADLREFDFREGANNAHKEDTSSFSFGAALRPLAGYGTKTTQEGLNEWTDDSLKALQLFAKGLLGAAAASAGLPDEERIQELLDEAFREAQESFFSSAPSIANFEIPFVVRTPLLRDGTATDKRIGQLVTALQFGLMVRRNARLRPGAPKGGWKLVTPLPPDKGKGGINLQAVPAEVSLAVAQSFKHWFSQRRFSVAAVSPDSDVSEHGVERTLLGVVPPRDGMRSINSSGDWIIPVTRREIDAAHFESFALAFAALPVWANSYFGQTADRSLAHFMTGLDECINATLSLSDADEWRTHFQALGTYAPKLQRIVEKVASLYMPTPSDGANANPGMSSPFRSWLRTQDPSILGNAGVRTRLEITRKLSRSPALFAHMKAFLSLTLKMTEEDSDIPGDIARVHICKQVAEGRSDDDTYYLFDGLDAKAAKNSLTLLDPLPDETYDSSFDVQSIQLSTFEDVIAETADVSHDNGRFKEKMQSRSRSQGAALIDTAVLTEDSSRAGTIDLPSRFRAVDPVFLDAGFIDSDHEDPNKLPTAVETLLTGNIARYASRIGLTEVLDGRHGEWTLTPMSSANPESDTLCGSLGPRRHADQSLYGALVLLRGDEEADSDDDFSQALNNDTVSIEFVEKFISHVEDEPAKSDPSESGAPTASLPLDSPDACLLAILRGDSLKGRHAALLSGTVLDEIIVAAEPDNSPETPSAEATTLGFSAIGDGKMRIRSEKTKLENPLKVRLFRAASNGSEKDKKQIFFVLAIFGYVRVWKPFELHIGQFRNLYKSTWDQRTQFDSRFANASRIVRSPSAFSPAVVRDMRRNRNAATPLLSRSAKTIADLIKELIAENPQIPNEQLTANAPWSDFDLSLTLYSEHTTRYAEVDRNGQEVKGTSLQQSRFPLLVWPASDVESGQKPSEGQIDLSADLLKGTSLVSLDLQWSRKSNHQFLRLDGIRARLRAAQK